MFWRWHRFERAEDAARFVCVHGLPPALVRSSVDAGKITVRYYADRELPKLAK